MKKNWEFRGGLINSRKHQETYSAVQTAVMASLCISNQIGEIETSLFTADIVAEYIKPGHIVTDLTDYAEHAKTFKSDKFAELLFIRQRGMALDVLRIEMKINQEAEELIIRYSLRAADSTAPTVGLVSFSNTLSFKNVHYLAFMKNIHYQVNVSIARLLLESK